MHVWEGCPADVEGMSVVRANTGLLSMWLRLSSTKGSMPRSLGGLGCRVFRIDNCKLLTSDSTMNLQAPSPRGSTYTTIRELGPIIPYIVWYFGAYFPNSCI